MIKKPQNPPVHALNFSQLYTRKSKSYDGQGGQAEVKKELAKKDKVPKSKPQKVENDYLPVQVRSLNLKTNKSFSFGKTANPYNTASIKRESDING